MRFVGVAYRAHNPRWSWSPLSGAGSAAHGGRFNRVGMPALYLSLSWKTAVVEASQGLAFRLPPLTIVSNEIDCEDVIDLVDATEMRRRRVRKSDLACAWCLLAARGEPVPSHALADRLCGDGIAGIIVPSFAAGLGPDAKNLVLWRWGATPPHRVTIIDPAGRLPKDDRSWR